MKLQTLLTPRHLKLALIAVPMVVGALYFGLIAADRYVSESTIAVRQADNDTPALGSAALLFGGANPSSREDTLYVQQYMRSLGLLRKLDEQLKLREHYEDAAFDPLYRLWHGDSQEDFLDYYRKRVEVHFDDPSSLLTVRVQGFEPAFAQRLNQALLEESERFVNAFSQQIATEQLRFAEGELKAAAARLQTARAQVLAFQTKNRLLDPLAQAQASGALTAELQASQSRLEAELKSLRSYLNDDAYQVKALRGQIEGLREQLQSERSRTTSAGKEGERLNALAADFQALQLQAEFALDSYKLALGAVEKTRLDATRKLKTLVVIEPASLPESAEYPARLYNLLTLLVAATLLYSVVRLVLATIREHQD
ncbi:MAG TPA: capsular biosynthesis protein [Methylibium sp.]|nr:capsular biosynthesis protein [Methylibium sp.]